MNKPDSALDPWGQTTPLQAVETGRGTVRVGARVRLEPVRSADIFDISLRGRVAVVEAIEQDFDDEIQVAVVVEDDPGRDLGEARLPGHRFFFRAAEVVPL